MDNASVFRTQIAHDVFNHKYKHDRAETWQELSDTLIDDVCNGYISKEDKSELKRLHGEMKFLAGGRYLYYAGRPHKFFNNCYLLRAEEDSREDWANLSWKSESCLTTGGGIGVDYSIYRASGEIIHKTGGYASGPIAKMRMINEIGREVMQGGSRRSAIYASLNWLHADAPEFLKAKNWQDQIIPGTEITFAEAKVKDFNFPAPLDMTNISLNYDNKFLEVMYGEKASEIWDLRVHETEDYFKGELPQTFIDNCFQACRTGEPGMSFNFYKQEMETLRNACCEITSEDDSDVCNLGSLNMSRFDSIHEWKEAVGLATKFLVCGTLVAQLPYDKVYKTREKNRRLGLGLMGVHEWLLKRGYKYEVVPELKEWLKIYKDESDRVAQEFCQHLDVSEPVGKRAIAPTGSIGLLAGTTTGIEPLLAVAYKRRYLKGKKNWVYQYVVDGTAKILIDQLGIDPHKIETALDLAKDYERRIKFQADVQDYVDHAISSTINLPEWGTDHNNEDTVMDFAHTLAKHSHRLRGFTCYPDGSRGGQPLTPVDYYEAKREEGNEYQEIYHDICDISGKGGTCGI
jgi:ribonucleoside-diphosphate reductase alpha chain